MGISVGSVGNVRSNTTIATTGTGAPNWSYIPTAGKSQKSEAEFVSEIRELAQKAALATNKTEAECIFNSSLNQMVSYDDSYVYVDREAFEKFLYNNNAEGEIYIVFGGLYKLPGFSSGGESCLYKAGAEDDVVRIPYEKRKDDWMLALFKLL